MYSAEAAGPQNLQMGSSAQSITSNQPSAYTTDKPKNEWPMILAQEFALLIWEDTVYELLTSKTIPFFPLKPHFQEPT